MRIKNKHGWDWIVINDWTLVAIAIIISLTIMHCN